MPKEFWLTKGPKKFWLEGKDLLNQFADRIGWTGPRNWWKSAPIGSWDIFRKKPYLGILRKFEVVYFTSMILFISWMLASVFYLGEVTGILASNWLAYFVTYFIMIIVGFVLYLFGGVDTLFQAIFGQRLLPVVHIDAFYEKVKENIKLIAVTVAALLLLALILNVILKLEVVTIFGIPGAFIITYIASVTVISFAEELTFRGVLTPTVAENFGVIPSIVISGLCFGIFHFGMAALLGVGLGMVLFSFIVGLALSFIILWKQSLATTVVIHSSFNAIYPLLMALLATLS